MKKRQITIGICSLSITIWFFIAQCNYNGNLINPSDPIAAHITLQGQIDEEIPKSLFSDIKSTQIGLIPMNDVRVPLTRQSPETYKKIANELGTIWFDSITLECLPITFNGSFPFNFNTEIRNLPSENDLQTVRSPSGKEYKLGIFLIALFDDVNYDKKINMSLIATGIVEQTNDSLNEITEFQSFKYGIGSDSLIALVPNHFIVYIETPGFTQELNDYISEKFSPNACWKGLTSGYNLVTLTTDFATLADTVFSGIQSVSQNADITLKSYSITDTINTFEPAVLNMDYETFFYFNRAYSDWNYASMYVKVISTSDTVVIRSNYSSEYINLQSDNYYYKNYTDTSIISLSIMAHGVFDFGYINNNYSLPCLTSPFTINSHPMAMGYFYNNTLLDTLVVNTDTLTIGFQESEEIKCKCNSLYIDSLVINLW